MPTKNDYKPKEKGKSIYSSSGVTNSSHTAAAGTQSMPQSNVWNVEQSTPRTQSNALQKPKREKSPSEMGVEVVRAMLEDEGLLEPTEAQQYSARVASDENSFEGSGDNSSASALDEPIDPVRPTPGEQTMAAIQEYPYLGQEPNVTWAGFWLGDKMKQLRDDTHLAPGMLLSSYLHDRGENAMDMVWEGAHNGMIDHARGGVNGDLEQEIQRAQLFAGWGGPYQQYADDITNTARAIQEVLPEAAEKFRKHDAAERAREIEEMYDAGGFIKLLGDGYSALRQTVPSILISEGTGIPALGVLFQGLSAGGNASTGARAAGADEDTAYVYGNFVNLVEAGTELWFGGIPGLPKGLLDDVLAKVPDTNMGRLALKAAQDALGEGWEEFVSTMAEAYLAKLWNGDERGAWQTFEETFPDALYAAFQGTTTSMIMNGPSNISNIQYARALDAAIDVLNNGGTLSEAEMAAQNAALQYLTESWGEDSAWSSAANQQWANTRSRHANVFFPPNYTSLPMHGNSAVGQENRPNPSDTNSPPITDPALNAADAQGQEIEIQDVEGNERNDPIEPEKDAEPESEALPSEEKGDMLSVEERQALGRAVALIPHIPSSLLDPKQQISLRGACRRILQFASNIPRDAEVTMLYRMDMTPIKENGIFVGEAGAGRVENDPPNGEYILIHNHPNGETFSVDDIKTFLKDTGPQIMVAVGHNGKVYILEKHLDFNSAAALELYDNFVEQYLSHADSVETYLALMDELIKGVEQYGASYYSG